MDCRHAALGDDDLEHNEDRDRDENENPELDGDECEIGRFRRPYDLRFETELGGEAEDAGEEDPPDAKIRPEDPPRGHGDKREQQQLGDGNEHGVGDDSEAHAASSLSWIEYRAKSVVGGSKCGKGVRIVPSAKLFMTEDKLGTSGEKSDADSVFRLMSSSDPAPRIGLSACKGPGKFVERKALRRLYYAAFTYTILGLLGGLYYRELTKAQDFPEDGFTQLSVVHTHLFALGLLVMLVVLALEKSFGLSRSKFFDWFFWLYNAGIVLTVGMLFVHGTMTVMGTEEVSPAISGIAGLGHILLTIALVLFFLALGKTVKSESAQPLKVHA